MYTTRFISHTLSFMYVDGAVFELNWITFNSIAQLSRVLHDRYSSKHSIPTCFEMFRLKTEGDSVLNSRNT